MTDNAYKCQSCGGIMLFDVETQTLKCPNCDNSDTIHNDRDSIVEHKLTIDTKRIIKAEAKSSKTVICSGCGAHMEIEGNETAAKCPYCDSSYVLAKEQESTLLPDGLVPFKLDKNEVVNTFRKWVKGRWLAPGELKNLYQHGGLKGVYIPYWTFDADADCRYTAQGGKDRREKYKDSVGNEKTRTVTDWHNTSGHIHFFFDDIQIAASKSYSGGFFRGIEPFNFGELVSYSAKYISGNISESYSIGLEEGHKSAISKMNSELKTMARRDVERRYDRSRNIVIRARFSKETYKYLLLPIYSTAYQYKNKTYNVLINGQTGKIKGEYPKSPVKIILILLAIIILIILYFVFIRG